MVSGFTAKSQSTATVARWILGRLFDRHIDRAGHSGFKRLVAGDARGVTPGKPPMPRTLFVSDRKPTYAGVDPYALYIDRNAADNVLPVS